MKLCPHIYKCKQTCKTVNYTNTHPNNNNNNNNIDLHYDAFTRHDCNSTKGIIFAYWIILTYFSFALICYIALLYCKVYQDEFKMYYVLHSNLYDMSFSFFIIHLSSFIYHSSILSKALAYAGLVDVEEELSSWRSRSYPAVWTLLSEETEHLEDNLIAQAARKEAMCPWKC